jgi:hypothetical protein
MSYDRTHDAAPGTKNLDDLFGALTRMKLLFFEEEIVYGEA